MNNCGMIQWSLRSHPCRWILLRLSSMQRNIPWASLRCHLWSTLTFLKALLRWPGWLCEETEWNGCGEATEVSQAQIFGLGTLVKTMISFTVSSLYELCAHAVVKRTNGYGIDRLPIPDSVKENLKSYAMTNYSTLRPGNSSHSKSVKYKKNRLKFISSARETTTCGAASRKSCSLS